MLDFCVSKNVSLIKILKTSGPIRESLGILHVNSNQSLQKDPNFVICLRLAK